jgi:cardiolipin synthase
MLRIVLAPILIYIAMNAGVGKAFLFVYVVAAASDFLDGFIARLLKETTPLGSLLDSIADFLLYISITLSFMIAMPAAFKCCNEPLALCGNAGGEHEHRIC